MITTSTEAATPSSAIRALSDGHLGNIVAFLYFLGHGPAFTEFQLRDRERGAPCIDRRFLALDEDWSVDILRYLLRINARQPSSLFFGINPRGRFFGGTNDDITAATAAVVDIDGKRLALDEQYKRLLRFVAHAPFGAFVNSGTLGHGHCYWRFAALIEPQRAARAVQRLCRWLGTDATQAPCRTMRLPMSWNWKAGSPRPIVFGSCPKHLIEIEQFEQALVTVGAPELDVERARAERAPRASAVPWIRSVADPTPNRQIELWGHLSAPTQQLVVRGRAAFPREYASRSEADLAVVRALVDAGATEDEIRWVFALPACGIGERYSEEADSDRYLQLAIDKVRSTRESSLAAIERVWPGERGGRVLLRLRVIEGPSVGVEFVQGVSSRSSAWPWFIFAAGLPEAPPAATERAVLATGAIVRVRIEATDHPGQPLQVVKWLPPLRSDKE